VWRRTGHASQTLVVLHLRAQGLEQADEHPLRSVAEYGELFYCKLLTTEPKPSENELNLNLVVLEPKPNHTLPYKELNRTQNQMSCFCH